MVKIAHIGKRVIFILLLSPHEVKQKGETQYPLFLEANRWKQQVYPTDLRLFLEPLLAPGRPSYFSYDNPFLLPFP